MRKYTDSPLWNAKLNRNMWRLYLRNGVLGSRPMQPPMLAADFTGLPKAYVEVEEFDCLHDEGLPMGGRCRAGVDVHLEDVKGTFHGFDVFRQAAKTREMIASRPHAFMKRFGNRQAAASKEGVWHETEMETDAVAFIRDAPGFLLCADI